ncbi:SDR family oxidoreductase [candidate division KSB3 bacterium]|uniref:SDR family oxidoreductase n=1 Tax=candidate division KSB3 bacterium TaxID=2044937 RepID=A0A9D5JW18_9BACT|nr:SDR family oxidoreductase [candidate division KSB3 bacterium]MBD3324996.1 SDR family oxidoreductase [candidate division KSB3 bacterium]
MDLQLAGKVAVITGAGGAICGEIAKAFASEGVCVAIWDVSFESACARRDEIRSAGGNALAVKCDATEKESVAFALKETLLEYGTVDILVNGAGGSRKETTTSDDLTFFDIDPEAMQAVLALNYLSAVIPSQAIGRLFAEKQAGVILNISSVAGICPVTRAISYSDGKAATNSFTRWLAVHMVQHYSPNIRVNAIAPGFMLTEQNRFLLIDAATGALTARGQQVIENVPVRRYGKAHEVVGAALWVVSEHASFVTGAVIPVDGGFTAFSGV